MRTLNIHTGDSLMYKFEDLLEQSLEYFGGDELAANVWSSKYALKDTDGNYYEKTPDDMHKRLAAEFARMEEKFGGKCALSEQQIYDQLKYFNKIVPQGSPMMGIGNNFINISLYCFHKLIIRHIRILVWYHGIQ